MSDEIKEAGKESALQSWTSKQPSIGEADEASQVFQGSYRLRETATLSYVLKTPASAKTTKDSDALSTDKI